MSDDRGEGGAADAERAPIEQALSLLAGVVNELPITVWMVDAHGVFTLSEGGALPGVGLARGQLVGQSVFERWAQSPAVLVGIRQALLGERVSQEQEAHGRTFAGRIVPVRDGNGAIAGAGGVAVDVTDRVDAQRALASAELSFRELIENAPDGMFVHDGAVVAYANRALATALGYPSADELIGAKTSALFLAKDREMLLERIRAAYETGAPNPPLEVEMKTKQGLVRWFECSSRAIEYGGAKAILVSGRDVEERRAMSARLIQAEQLASLGTLAAGVAHEINNPLTYVLMNLELVKRRVRAGDTTPVASVAREIEAAVEGIGRVRDIVADLRAFSRPSDGAGSLLDVRHVVDSAVRMAWAEIHHRARLERVYDEIPPVFAGESRLAQVFLNLLVNAAQSFPEGEATSHTIRVRTRVDAGNVVVEIADDGPGMSEETRARAFEPFFTTKPPGVGTGLGLSICRSIITSLGGGIEIESALGLGTTFRVRLPARVGPPAARLPSTPPGPGPEVLRGLVLVVDDEREIGEGLKIALAGAWDVNVAVSAAEAMECFETSTRYDAVVCDLMMPDVSGIQLYEQVRGRDAELAARFVFMTGGAFTTAARAFLETATVPYLEKPFGVEELLAALARARDAGVK